MRRRGLVNGQRAAVQPPGRPSARRREIPPARPLHPRASAPPAGPLQEAVALGFCSRAPPGPRGRRGVPGGAGLELPVRLLSPTQ